MAHLKDLIVNGASRFIGKAYGAFVGSFSGNLDGNATTSTTANTAKACSGNSATATKLQTPRTLSLTGKAAGSATFDGSANAAINVTSVNADTAMKATQDSLGNNITDTYATKTALDAVSKKADIQADWNSTDSSSIAFIKNIPNSIKSINNSDNFRIKKFVKNDNNGYPTYKIVEELTCYHPTNRPSMCGVYGFSVVVLYDVRWGNGYHMDPAFMYASLGYEYNMLKSTSSDDFPVVLHNIESDKYYVAIRTNGSSRGVTFMGDFANPDIELGEEILAQDSDGTPPSGWELTYKPKDMLSMGQLQAGRANDALKLTVERLIKLTGDMTGDIYFDGSKDITVNTTVNESKHAVNADVAKVISGFAKIDKGTWGHSTGTYITGFQESGGGSIQWRAKGGNLYERVDGTFWQREGAYEVIDTSTVNNYAPTKTGGGASGTWGISITGNANTASTASSVAWDGVTGKPETYPPSAHNHDSAYPSVTGTRASGTWGISISGNAASATKAIQDASGNIIADTYATKTALSTKQEKLTFDTTPTKDSTNPVTSNGVKAYVDQAIASIVNADNKSY